MSDPLNDDLRARRECMSALADGDADAGAHGCALWHTDPAAREAWHTYHLIGDVLRSDELAATSRHDAAFLQAVRNRLAAEPTVMAPAAADRPPATGLPAPRRRAWMTPAAAVAAGFVAVAGVLVVMRPGVPGTGPDAGPLLAATEGAMPVSAGPARASVGADRGGDPQWQLVDGKLIRDARLDAYLRAHRAGQPAMPGGATGRFDTVVLERQAAGSR